MLGLLRLIVFIGLVYGIVVLILRLVRQRSFQSPGQTFDPYEVLEISRTATQAQIKEAYLNQLSKYHPDKVEHLGKELQTFAREKTTQIIEAYKRLS